MVNNQNEEVSFEDAESSGFTFGKNSISFREIVLRQLQKIVSLSNQEFIKGRWEVLPVKVGGMIIEQRKYIEDSREAYSNAVDALFDICLPYFDDFMKAVWTEHDESFKSLEEEAQKDNDQENFREEKRLLKRWLFQQLNIFMKKSDYFAESSIEEKA